MDKFDRLLSDIRGQQEELLLALKKTYQLARAECDERARESREVRADLTAVYEVLERNKRDREQRISALIR
jgi:hypothetical protein